MANSSIPEPLSKIAQILLIIGGLNWGLVGVANTNLVTIIADATAGAVGTLVYVLVGISAIIAIIDLAMKSSS